MRVDWLTFSSTRTCSLTQFSVELEQFYRNGWWVGSSLQYTPLYLVQSFENNFIGHSWMNQYAVYILSTLWEATFESMPLLSLIMLTNLPTSQLGVGSFLTTDNPLTRESFHVSKTTCIHTADQMIPWQDCFYIGAIGFSVLLIPPMCNTSARTFRYSHYYGHLERWCETTL